MVIIILIWNNQTYKYEQGFNHKLFLHVVLMLFFCIGIESLRWGRLYVNAMLFCGVFYAVWTFAAYLNSHIFYNIIYPIVGQNAVDNYYLIMYRLGYMAGFTSHYSTNGMYLSIGICAAIGYTIGIHNNKKTRGLRLISIILTIILLVALLLTGKRGPVLYVGICFFIWFYYYNSDKPASRLFKFIAIALSLLLVLSLIALIVPGIFNVIKRFKEMGISGNISSNRFYLWSEAWNAFKESPILGKGWYWFKYHNSKGPLYHVHCVYLQWICELGLAGSIPFFLFTAVSYKHALFLIVKTKTDKLYSPHDKEIIITVFWVETFFLLFNLTGTGFYEIQVLVPYIMGCACLEAYYIQYKNRKLTE